MTSPASPSSDRSPLGEVARLFLRLGFTAFGGPAAHIALMEEEVVRKRSWVSHEELVDLIGAVNLIPGPNSTELAIHLGHRRAGWLGLLVAGACFITPSALMAGALAWAYVRFGFRPEVAQMLAGVQPVVLAVVTQALWTLGKVAVKDAAMLVIALGSFALGLVGMHELLILAIAGGAALVARRTRGSLAVKSCVPLLGAVLPAAPTTPAVFLVFLKIGSVLFGSGYVLLAFLNQDLVQRTHWLTERQLLDAVAVGQITPGPVFTAATFVGYLLQGAPGAVAATAGIFLPAFVLVAASGAILPRLRASPIARAILDGVNAGSLALMAAVLIPLGKAALAGPIYALEALVAAVLLIRFRVGAGWLLGGGAALGLLAAVVH
ncbi:MAG: chromate efflux transporter [Deltaproteobacteria bacterium]|nr:chromate efflux transporter [Deltaproteobacteria bacterium]